MKTYKRLFNGWIHPCVYNNIFSAVSTKLRSKSTKNIAVMILEDDCVVGVTYEKLVNDALSLAHRIEKKGYSAILVHGGGGYEVALTLLAACVSGLPIILCDESADTAAIEGMLSECGTVFSISDKLSRSDMDFSELRTAVEENAFISDRETFHRQPFQVLLP